MGVRLRRLGAQAEREAVAGPIIGASARGGLVPTRAAFEPHGARHALLQVRRMPRLIPPNPAPMMTIRVRDGPTMRRFY
jgi:hypothetical protein